MTGSPPAVVLANPRARHLRRHPDLLDDLRATLGPGVPILVPDGLDALDAQARALIAHPPPILALLGGDGTLGRSLSALVRASAGRELPPIALLGGGTMNTIARSMGARGSPRRLARRLVRHLQDGQALQPVARHLLEVDGQRHGFLFGNGLFARYIHAYEQGDPGPLRAAWVLFRAVWSALTGGAFARALTQPSQATLIVDGEVVQQGRWLLAAAGTVDQVGLGFRPFTGAVEQPGKLHALGIGCSPFALALQLHRPRRGLPFRHPSIVECVGTELVVRGPPNQPFSLDGDLGVSGPVTRVRVGPAVTFLVPGC